MHRFGMKKAADYLGAIRMHDGIVLDRCIAGDRVFMAVNQQLGHISQLEVDTYEYAYEILSRDLQPPTLLIYLDATPETALRRLQARSRDAEVGVDLVYLAALREGYETLLSDLEAGKTSWGRSVEYIRINWDKDVLDEREWDAIAQSINDLCMRKLRRSK